MTTARSMTSPVGLMTATTTEWRCERLRRIGRAVAGAEKRLCRSNISVAVPVCAGIVIATLFARPGGDDDVAEASGCS